MNKKLRRLFFYGAGLLVPAAQAAPVPVNIDDDIVNITTDDSGDNIYNVTNDGVLNIVNASAGFDTNTWLREKHYLNDSTLSLSKHAILNGGILTSDSNIFISESTLNGSIDAEAGKAFGNLYADGAIIQGGITSGSENQGNIISLKDTSVMGNTGIRIESGGIALYGSNVSMANVAGLSLNNVESAHIERSKIVGTSSSGAIAPGVSGITAANTNLNVIDSELISNSNALWATGSKVFIHGSNLYSSGSSAILSTASELNIQNTVLRSDALQNNGGCASPSMIANCGALMMQGGKAELAGTSIESRNTGIVITSPESTYLTMMDSTIAAAKDAVLVSQGAIADINIMNTYNISNGMIPTITSETDRLLTVQDGSRASMRLYNVNAAGDVVADSTSLVSVKLDGHSLWTGDTQNVDSIEIGRNSTWSPGKDNDINELFMAGGDVVLNNHDTFVTLTTHELSGNGAFWLRTDMNQLQGDMLNVTGQANGAYTLHIANTGIEPSQNDAALKVVQTGGGNAFFDLAGNKVDIGVWQYDLVKKGNSWYLNTGDTDTNLPDDENTPDPEHPAPPDEDSKPDPDIPALPERDKTTSATTDAVLSLANAPLYTWQNELRRVFGQQPGNKMRKDEKDNVWITGLNDSAKVRGENGNAARFTQQGVVAGAQKKTMTPSGLLSLGVFTGYSQTRLAHQRGGTSHVSSTQLGMTGGLRGENGVYLDGVIKMNRFRNQLRSTMTEGTPVRGGYHQQGIGVAVEAGKHAWLSEQKAWWATPYVRLSTAHIGGNTFTASNGMKAAIESQASFQGEVGGWSGVDIALDDITISPYVNVAVSHEFVKNNRVTLNDRWTFNNRAETTSARVGGGVEVKMDDSRTFYAGVTHQQGRYVDSSLSGTLGVDVRF